jgi:NAD(P)-dependent dehydrogenase (short-subunit alcohol dehydrogenase family)
VTEGADIRFDGQVAIVTGAGGGIGREHALLLAQRGSAVVVNDTGGAVDGSGASTAAQSVVDEIVRAGGDAVASTASVATPQGGQQIVETALASFGRVDAVVHNAGILRDRTFANMDLEGELLPVMQVHLLGAFHVGQPAFRAMKEQRYGRFVLTSSGSGLWGAFGQSNYGAAKAGLVGLTHVLALEGERLGIKVNAIAPNALTRMTAPLDKPFGTAPAEAFPPSLVSPFVAYLCSRECEVNGEIFSVGGGQVSRIFLGLSRGVFRQQPPWTPEELRDRLGQIRDTTEFIVPSSFDDETAKLEALLGEL